MIGRKELKLNLYNRMYKVIKTMSSFIVVSILFSQSVPISAQEGRIDLDFKKQTLSAKIERAPLKGVIARIKEEKNIWFKFWFKSNGSLLNEQVSVRFKSLPLQDALERILSGLNHSLIFNKDGDLLGVILLGKSQKRIIRSRRRVITPRRGQQRYRRR